MGTGQLYTGMDGDGDDLETIVTEIWVRIVDGDQSSEDGRGWVPVQPSILDSFPSPSKWAARYHIACSRQLYIARFQIDEA